MNTTRSRRYRTWLAAGLFLAACGLAWTPGEIQAEEREGKISPATARPSLEQFDQDMARSRREMRQYCGLVQLLMQQQTPAPRQQQEALTHLREARSLWKAVRSTYAVNPPAAYAADPRFGQRLADIEGAIEEMESHLAAGRFKESFRACGFGCGLFVQLHEENGLVYALDRLFHLRKVTKAAIAAGSTGGPAAVSPLLPDLLYYRNSVVLAPCPWPEDQAQCDAYRESVAPLSAFLDGLGQSVTAGDGEQTAKRLGALMAILNKAYGAAL